MVTSFRLFSRFAQTVVLSLSAASLAAAADPSVAAPGGAGPGSGSSSIVVTVVGFACAGAGTSRAKVPQAALVDARQKGRDYAVSEIESKTTLENGAPRVDQMNAEAGAARTGQGGASGTIGANGYQNYIPKAGCAGVPPTE